MAGDYFEALSADIEPKGLNPLAVGVMREVGIDISRRRSKDVREFLGSPIPYISTVCDNAKEHCPIFPGTFTYMHWSIEDPAAVQGTEEESWRCSDESGITSAVGLRVLFRRKSGSLLKNPDEVQHLADLKVTE